MSWLLSTAGFILGVLHNGHIGIHRNNFIMHSAAAIDEKFDYLEEHNFSISELAKRRRINDHVDSGCDRHLPEDDPVILEREIARLSEMHEKMKVLRALENTSLSIYDRVAIAEQYCRNCSESPLVFNVSAGGLCDDWDRSSL
jgi:hypothetical protein